MTLLLAIFSIGPGLAAPEAAAEPTLGPALETFLRGGLGSPHEDAPPETAQFGRLVGLWNVETEVARRGGGWAPSASGLWAFKYTLGGFAVSDLWRQGAENLPEYMANLGRDYLLESHRIYDVARKRWRVAWMANGAGTVMGADAGTFTAKLVGTEIVMTSSGEPSLQRVVFSEIGETSFLWRSEYSMDDGKSWMTVMRMRARRIERPR